MFFGQTRVSRHFRVFDYSFECMQSPYPTHTCYYKEESFKVALRCW